MSYSSNDMYGLAKSIMTMNKYGSYDAKMALMEKGLTEAEADSIVGRIQDEMYTAARKAALRTMLIGGGIFILGLIITFGTYSAAKGGGRFVITYGLIFAGVAQFARGLYAYSTAD